MALVLGKAMCTNKTFPLKRSMTHYDTTQPRPSLPRIEEIHVLTGIIYLLGVPVVNKLDKNTKTRPKPVL